MLRALVRGGAKRCILPFADLGEIRSPGDVARIRARRMEPRGIELMTVHIMGSARMALVTRNVPRWLETDLKPPSSRAR